MEAGIEIEDDDALDLHIQKLNGKGYVRLGTQMSRTIIETKVAKYLTKRDNDRRKQELEEKNTYCRDHLIRRVNLSDSFSCNIRNEQLKYAVDMTTCYDEIKEKEVLCECGQEKYCSIAKFNFCKKCFLEGTIRGDKTIGYYIDGLFRNKIPDPVLLAEMEQLHEAEVAGSDEELARLKMEEDLAWRRQMALAETENEVFFCFCLFVCVSQSNGLLAYS